MSANSMSTGSIPPPPSGLPLYPRLESDPSISRSDHKVMSPKGIRKIDLRNCSSKDEVIYACEQHIRSLRTLSIQLRVDGNDLEDILHNVPRLVELRLYKGCFKEGRDLWERIKSKCVSLRALKLNDYTLSRECFTTLFSTLPKLTSLTLSGVKIYEEGLLDKKPRELMNSDLRSLKSLKDLQKLDLSNNPNLTRKAFETLDRLSLTKLDLRRCPEIQVFHIEHSLTKKRFRELKWLAIQKPTKRKDESKVRKIIDRLTRTDKLSTLFLGDGFVTTSQDNTLWYAFCDRFLTGKLLKGGIAEMVTSPKWIREIITETKENKALPKYLMKKGYQEYAYAAECIERHMKNSRKKVVRYDASFTTYRSSFPRKYVQRENINVQWECTRCVLYDKRDDAIYEDALVAFDHQLTTKTGTQLVSLRFPLNVINFLQQMWKRQEFKGKDFEDLVETRDVDEFLSGVFETMISFIPTYIEPGKPCIMDREYHNPILNNLKVELNAERTALTFSKA